MAKKVGIKERVKSGKLKPESALKKVDITSATYGWLTRRMARVHPPQAEKGV